MKKKTEKLENDIIKLLLKQQFLMHQVKLEQLFNKEFEFEEIIDVDDKVNDFIHTSKKLGVPIHDDIKIHKPFKQIRQEIIETTSLDNKDESIFLKGNQIKVLKLLHESYMNNEPGMSWDSIRDKMDKSLPEGKVFNPENMYQVFKGNPKAWKRLITNSTKGFYRINLP